MTHLSRRGFLAATAAAAAPLFLPARAFASPPALTLRATTRTLDIAGRAVTVKGLLDPQGRSGLVLDPAQPFRVDLVNDLAAETSIHWHGQVPPNAQDGVPGAPQPALQPGE
ncbi:MAG: multicopper oxidase domain-containing protein, partial [Pseudomonadota bacterium]